ncbi:MAG: sulfotransferase domain-containing protein [Phycisphaeraceae bacterium]|nr:sulfotransferase domain-containing protein [Phycisphaeraceae bacterium]MBX3366120.1 sulfotransferase domain-containing protein [Phycisphaeraceae bacterium]
MTQHPPRSESSRTGGLDFVVLASAKSGTTWMQRLLSAHPQVHCSESRLFGRYFDKDNPSGPNLTVESYIENLARHYHPPVPTPDAPAFYQSLLHNVIDAVAQTARDASDKPLYGEKFTPYLGTGQHAIEQLHRYNPALKLINLVRDGRDVVVSGAAHWSNLQLRTATHERAAEIRDALSNRRVLAQPFEFFTELWIDSATAGQRANSLFDSVLTIQYEQMLASPIQTTVRVLRFIGADPAHAERCVESASFRALSGGRNSGQEDPTSFFRRGVAGDWQTWLSDEQIAAFDARAGSLLESLGYERSITASATT